MKLLIAVVNKKDCKVLRDALINAGYRFTEISSAGGFFREGNVTLLIGVTEEQMEGALSVIGAHCKGKEEAVNITPPDTRMYAPPVGEAMTVPIGGAQVFVLNVERVVHV